ncbi:Oidioi.mRNA.OKI2018_I69.XSR.g14958.t2.cds [Oikopleura dioica]|nr:Oidioi.mRNA.OKI2018_I69.XSR.g14958.t2.cds [Oikopleura dioica]
MITFYFDCGAVLTMRTSGTEPKIKYYSEMIGSSLESCKSELDELIEHMVNNLYKPEVYGLIARSLN